MSQSTPPGNWDGPWYRVHTEQFAATFLPDAHEDLESVNNIDVEVQTKDGSRWSGTLFTLDQVEVLMNGWAASGEAHRCQRLGPKCAPGSGGRYRILGRAWA